MSSIKKVLIIGAGPAGLSCGYELARNGISVEVFEASGEIGGMARSFELWGQRVDVGPHRFFSKEKNINRFFTDLIQQDYVLVNRLTRIYYNNRYFYYPLKLFNVLVNLPLLVIVKILFDYVRIRVFPIKDPKTFEDWVINKFGRQLFKIFFKNYSEKLWGIPCSKIDADWAAQRIKSLSLWAAIKSALTGNVGNKHKTLVDQFPYPNTGSGTLYERAAAYIAAHGGRIHLKAEVRQVLQDDSGKVIGLSLKDGAEYEADYVVSTMPLTYLVNGLNAVPAEVKSAVAKLYFRNTLLVYLEINAINLFEDNWIYVHSPEVRHGRITNFRNWSKEMYGDRQTTILCLEYWAFDQDELWNQDELQVIDMAKQEVRNLQLIPMDCDILNTKVLRVPKCYPVYETGYKFYLNKVEGFLDTVPGLIPIGRYGAFKYNNQDHSILMGLLAAEKIIKGTSIDLWAINTDIEYQEEGKIKDVLT